MDLDMPELDGLDATRLIRSRWPEREIPIYAVTGTSDDGVSTRCRRAGMDGYLPKPVSLQALAGILP